ncbi:MAG: hypothetical protein IKJ36_02595 [Clostridia bacterium]|nr:hypothetical protein [Clostridia bacterium]
MSRIKEINSYKLRIESLLLKVTTSSIKHTDLDVRGNVYKTIEECFIYIEGNDVTKKDKIEKFKFNYEHISGKSLDDLLDEKFDIERLITDLKELVNCVEV